MEAGSGYGALQCNPVNSCPGSAGNCEPRFVWSGQLNSGTNYYASYLNNGSFGNSNYVNTNAFGVRCVPDLKASSNTDIQRLSGL